MKKTSYLLLAALTAVLSGSITESSADGRGFRGHGGYDRHGGVSVWLEPGWGSYYAPHYYPYYYPYYQEPPIVIEQQPEVYVQPLPPAEQQPVYWYYCKNPQGYYPYVKRCPDGWTKVAPTPPVPYTAPPN
jgi:hypothetical protein